MSQSQYRCYFFSPHMYVYLVLCTSIQEECDSVTGTPQPQVEKELRLVTIVRQSL